MRRKNTLIKNAPGQTLADCIRCLINNDVREFCVAAGYWDIPGMSLVLPEITTFLANGGKIRIIIGEEPAVREYQLAPERIEEICQFPDCYIKLEVDDLRDECKPVIRLLLQYYTDDDSQIQIRVFGQDKTPKQFMHAKCCIFRGMDSVGIIGGANFTKRELEDSTELSCLKTDSRIVSAVANSDSSSRGPGSAIPRCGRSPAEYRRRWSEL